MAKLAEYRDIPADAPRVVTTTIAEAPSKVTAHRVIRLVEQTAGWACAGSMARWDDACFAVLFDECGATHGRRFKDRAAAEALFKTWTH